MIIQGSNSPVILAFSVPVEGAKDMSVLLTVGDKPQKRWSLAEVVIDGNTVTCPLTQAETLHFLPGRGRIEAKWTVDGSVILSNQASVYIERRDDKTEVEI